MTLAEPSPECGLCLCRPCGCDEPEPAREIHGYEPACPYCGAMTVYSGDLRLYDGDETEATCGKCERDFVVRLVVTHDYYSRKKGVPR